MVGVLFLMTAVSAEARHDDRRGRLRFRRAQAKFALWPDGWACQGEALCGMEAP